MKANTTIKHPVCQITSVILMLFKVDTDSTSIKILMLVPIDK